MTVLRIVADLGNSRLKWGRVASNVEVVEAAPLPLHDLAAWEAILSSWGATTGPVAWAISSVNPPMAARLAGFLDRHDTSAVRWFRSAEDVPIRHELIRPEATGADRALAVLAATRLGPGPILVVACGTAITVERVSGDGTWQGGAIAAGLRIAARALNQGTAQLPEVAVEAAPQPWGRDTGPALAAGVFWGAVGAIRELLRRQAEGLEPAPRVVFTGGDAETLGRAVDWPGAELVPDLVLRGLAIAGFEGEAS